MAGNFLNNYFGFNKQQRNGLLVMALISFSLLLIRIIYPYFITPRNIIIQNLPLTERKLDSSFNSTQNKYQNNFSETKTNTTFFVFDPNTVSFNELLQLGFKEKAAKTFLKFRDKGFVFKQKEDLKKVYGISENLYAKLEPYVLIENRTIPEQKTVNNTHTTSQLPVKNKIKTVVELNSADSLALIDLNGIGPAFAKRILKYRSMLGGFVTTEQLKEVYGFTDEMYVKIKLTVSADAGFIKKLDLNKDDFKSINKHPYLSYELTKAIFDLRRKTAITAANLKDIINDGAVYNKLLPYLQF